MPEMLTSRKLAVRIVISLAVLGMVMGMCAVVGAQKISLRKVFAGPGEVPGGNIDYEIFVGVRLPRVLLAALVGAALACSGVRNKETICR